MINQEDVCESNLDGGVDNEMVNTRTDKFDLMKMCYL